MKLSLYPLLSTLFTAQYMLKKSSSLSQITEDEVQKSTPVNTLSTDTLNKETKANLGFSSSCQSPYKWERFDSWTCNTPQVSQFESAQLFIKSSREPKDYLYRILLFGGKNKPHNYVPPGFELQNTTWIYYEETNSWKPIDNFANGPPAMSALRLVTLCSSDAIVVQLYDINSTWTFTTKQLEWKRVTIEGCGPHDTSDIVYIYLVAAVAVKNSNSSCACNEDVLVFVFEGGESMNQLACYRLSCVIEHTKYRWQKVGIYSLRTDRIQTVPIGISAPPGKILFFLVEKCILTYSVKKSSWNKSKMCFQVDPTTDSIFRPIFLSDTGEILFFTKNHSVIRLSLSNTSTFLENILGYSPNIEEVYSVREVSDSKMIVYLSEEHCGSSTLILERIDVARVWVWKKIKKTILFPSDYALQSFWNDVCYRIVVSSSDVSIASDQLLVPPVLLWSLNMRTMKWQLQRQLNATGINTDEWWHISKSTKIQENVWLIVSASYTTLITSNNHIQQMTHPISRRSGFTLVTTNSSSALLFGGTDNFGFVFNDLWKFSLTQMMWKNVAITEHEWSVPPHRFGHAAAVIGFDMFVIGGHNGSIVCTQELWKYNLINNSWSILIANKNFLPYHVRSDVTCRFAMIAQAKMLWISATVYSNTRHDVSDSLWMFILHSHTLTHIATGPTRLRNSVIDYILAPSSLVFWQEYVVDFGHDSTGVMYMKVGCPGGLASSDISRSPCDFCKVGFYTYNVGSTECLKCSKGTTTKEEGSSSITECNVCIAGYCLHGRCLVVSNNSTQVPVCTCTIGFTGSRCQYATYYYIGMGVIVGIAIVTIFVIVLWRIIKARRARESAFRHHIKTLNDAWQISWKEIGLQSEIGGGASGRVWKAHYRDMDVAVKILIGDDDPQSSSEFAQEIKFMQTMRHPSIVLFIGAGTTSPQEQPFLVVEFVQRGSLRQVLDDVSIEMTSKRKIAFAVDASKGMEFLHKLDPPRIHRDVKSDNLLVSQSWVVKVADFGLGKSLRSMREHRQLNRYRQLIDNQSQTDSLYEMREDFSEVGIGTVRWSAPELSRRQRYDASIDVYRYSLTFVYSGTKGFLLYFITFVYLVLELSFGRFGHVAFLSSSIGLGTKSMTPSKEANVQSFQTIARMCMQILCKLAGQEALATDRRSAKL